MADDRAVLRVMYDRFNARDIDGVLGALTDDVAWANGMEGGHVHGREGVREYWTRQWAIVSPHVEPVSFDRDPDGSIVVEFVSPSAICRAGRCKIKRTGSKTKRSGTSSICRMARSPASTSEKIADQAGDRRMCAEPVGDDQRHRGVPMTNEELIEQVYAAYDRQTLMRCRRLSARDVDSPDGVSRSSRRSRGATP